MVALLGRRCRHAEHTPMYFPCLLQVLFSEYENNLEVANEQLDTLRNQLLTEEIQKKGK